MSTTIVNQKVVKSTVFKPIPTLEKLIKLQQKRRFTQLKKLQNAQQKKTLSQNPNHSITQQTLSCHQNSDSIIQANHSQIFSPIKKQAPSPFISKINNQERFAQKKIQARNFFKLQPGQSFMQKIQQSRAKQLIEQNREQIESFLTQLLQKAAQNKINQQTDQAEPHSLSHQEQIKKTQKKRKKKKQKAKKKDQSFDVQDLDRQIQLIQAQLESINRMSDEDQLTELEKLVNENGLVKKGKKSKKEQKKSKKQRKTLIHTLEGLEISGTPKVNMTAGSQIIIEEKQTFTEEVQVIESSSQENQLKMVQEQHDLLILRNDLEESFEKHEHDHNQNQKNTRFNPTASTQLQDLSQQSTDQKYEIVNQYDLSSDKNQQEQNLNSTHQKATINNNNYQNPLNSIEQPLKLQQESQQSMEKLKDKDLKNEEEKNAERLKARHLEEIRKVLLSIVRESKLKQSSPIAPPKGTIIESLPSTQQKPKPKRGRPKKNPLNTSNETQSSKELSKQITITSKTSSKELSRQITMAQKADTNKQQAVQSLKTQKINNQNPQPNLKPKNSPNVIDLSLDSDEESSLKVTKQTKSTKNKKIKKSNTGKNEKENGKDKLDQKIKSDLLINKSQAKTPQAKSLTIIKSPLEKTLQIQNEQRRFIDCYKNYDIIPNDKICFSNQIKLNNMFFLSAFVNISFPDQKNREIVKLKTQTSDHCINYLEEQLRSLKSCDRAEVKIPEDNEVVKVKLKRKYDLKDKKILALDLDETLIHSVQVAGQDQIMTKQQQTKLYQKYKHIYPYKIQCEQTKKIQRLYAIRNHARDFIKIMSMYYYVIIFTSAQKGYADKIIDELDPDNKYIQDRLYRNNCYNCFVNTPGATQTLADQDPSLPSTVIYPYVKDLRIINKPLSDVLLVDNSILAYYFQMHNGVPIIPFEGEQDDQLKKLQLYLIKLSKVDDVREVNKKVFRNEQYRNCQVIDDILKIYKSITLQLIDEPTQQYDQTEQSQSPAQMKGLKKNTNFRKVLRSKQAKNKLNGHKFNQKIINTSKKKSNKKVTKRQYHNQDQQEEFQWEEDSQMYQDENYSFIQEQKSTPKTKPKTFVNKIPSKSNDMQDKIQQEQQNPLLQASNENTINAEDLQEVSIKTRAKVQRAIRLAVAAKTGIKNMVFQKLQPKLPLTSSRLTIVKQKVLLQQNINKKNENINEKEDEQVQIIGSFKCSSIRENHKTFINDFL